MEKIDISQMEKLFTLMGRFNVSSSCIKGVCNVDQLKDITVRQYNFLLLLFQSIEEN